MGDPTSITRYRQHSSWDHVTTQAPPLRQSRDKHKQNYSQNEVVSWILQNILWYKNLVLNFTGVILLPFQAFIQPTLMV
jgi:hypothetical protein